MNRLRHAFAARGRPRLVVLGDVILDRFVFGTIERVSPEAPIPVLAIAREEPRLGGAANVAANLLALGATCDLVTTIGCDDAGRELAQTARDAGLRVDTLIADAGLTTTVKTRFVAAAHQLLRADIDNCARPSSSTARAVIAALRERLAGAQCLVLSDYDKGLLAPQICRAAIAAASAAGVPVAVDPRLADYAKYAGAALVTPNRRELGLAAGLPVASLDEVRAAMDRLAGAHGLTRIAATLGREGIAWRQAEVFAHWPAEPREVFDVTGAGDTVLAVLALGLAIGWPAEVSVPIANAAGGLAVEHFGTGVIDPAHLLASLGPPAPNEALPSALSTEPSRAQRTAAARRI